VLPNGVDVEGIRALVDFELTGKIAERWHISSEAFVGLSVGRLEANKGFEYLLRALASCSESLGAEWRWLFVGEGSQRKHLEELAAALGLASHVSFTGKISDSELHTLYSMCNLFVHPTLYEGSSLVTLEAMAHALPVVASATGGIPDKVIPTETGFLVKPGEEAELAQRIVWMASHPAERVEMGRRALEVVRRRFSWEQVAAATEALFYTLVEEKAACKRVEATSASC
jgi:glycosyltransferase involved in cell wall biosynthesis